METILIWYYSIINVVLFLVYGVDKLCAKKNWWRVPEHTLLLLGLIGGAVGGLVGMLVWHHKTRKVKFWLVNILAIPLHVCVWFGVYSILGNIGQ